jgi:bacterioferritin (cytochrome b1)
MKNDELISKLQYDLKNERKHLAFYMHAAVMVKGINRKELKEFFEEEAQGEFKHVIEFSETIVYLGGNPDSEVNDFPRDLYEPEDILCYASKMEFEVSHIYAGRLKELGEFSIHSDSAVISYLDIFYENQLEDSWRAAQEISQMVKSA